MQIGFGSDNHAPIHPTILNYIQLANSNHCQSYGGDTWTTQAEECFRKQFGQNTKAFFVFNGTAANCLSLRLLTQPGESILCSDVSHIHIDESAGPEFFTQCKLEPVKSINGKLTIEELNQHWIRRGDIHYAQSTVISITQPTELGTTYTKEELSALISWSKSRGLRVHIDGARLSNAVTFLNSTFKESTTDLGVDVISFGGTKNGLLGGEAILLLNPSTSNATGNLGRRLEVLRKQAGQLPSKTRFISSQFVGYFTNDTWKDISLKTHQLARRLEQGLKRVPSIQITQPIESNAVFAIIPKELYKTLREKYFFYVWDEKTWECRLMISWDLQESHIDDFISICLESTT